MQVHVLASGSTGNAILLQAGEINLLVDAGISARAISSALEELKLKGHDLAGVFLTHEHTDHVKGLETLARKYHIPVFARYKTWLAMACTEQIPEPCRYVLKENLALENIEVEVFPVSHDAAEPVGFAFTYKEQKAVIITDLGRIDYHLLEKAAYADIIVLESNHDPDMLHTGPYPYFLKKRISGPKGHLSNEETGTFLCHMPKKEHLSVLLAHLSQNNNTLPLAKYTVSKVLFEHGADDIYNQVSLFPTYPQKTVSVKVF